MAKRTKVSFEPVARIDRDEYRLVKQILCCRDGARFVTHDGGPALHVWDLESGAMLQELRGHEQPLWTVQLSPDGLRAVTGSHDRSVRVWELESGRELLRIDGHGQSPGAAFSADGRRIAVATGTSVRVIDGSSGITLVESPFDAPVRSIAFDSTGTRIFTGCSGAKGITGEAVSGVVWDADTGSMLHEIPGHLHRADGTFSPDGRRLATWSDLPTARIWDVGTGGLLAECRDKDRLWRVAFSPDGTQVATASDDKVARVWDASTGALSVELKGHRKGPQQVEFSADRRRILTASTEATARVWDAATGTCIAALMAHGMCGGSPSYVSAVAFAPDGERIITGSYGLVLVWQPTSG